tara:strand:- start:587 stop:877 length:291 start_codon:yes stop_codon:yes gene_type:complete
MAKPTIKYVAIYGMVDTPDSPSAVARLTRCKDPIIYKTEICTPKSGWEESSTVVRHFIGLESNSEPITDKVAMHFVDSWRDRWPQPRFQTGEDDLR